MNVERPRGTRDFTPEEMRKRAYIERVLRSVVEKFNYQEVLFPAFEHAELFSLKSGEEISDHMYVFKDKGERSLCLRPEATASVARMFGTSLRERHRPVKVYYFGPMYRYEEPQKNRYREFWQFGVEVIGASSRESDAEAVLLAEACLATLGVKHSIEISHLGVMRSLLEDMGIPESQQDHVIACLDRKNLDELKKIVSDELLFSLLELSGGRSVIEKARDLLGGRVKALEKLEELDEAAALLDAAKVGYKINLGMARGLAYYTGMIMELRVPALGAQNQICGGGRYDNLVKLFSGLDEPAVGFAFGFDRLLDAVETQKIPIPPDEELVIVAPASDEARGEAFEIANQLRRKIKRKVELDLMNRKLGRVLEYAAKARARYVVIVGLKELKEDKVIVRDMERGEQKEVVIDDIYGLL